MHDMEQLAEMVLNGDGQFLVDTKSDQPEIQAFLDNVPVYMVRTTNQLNECLITFAAFILE